MSIGRKIITLFTALCSLGTAQAQYEQYEVVTNERGEREEIVVPQQFTLEVDSLLALYHSKMYLRESDDCNMMNYDPETDDETIIERMRRMPTAMEMPFNEAVRTFIDRYTKRGRKQVRFLLGASNFYIPIFEQALESYGLPLELKYLPIIESGLNPNAVSRAGATGLWQLMLETAKHYNLEINSLVDERRDPEKSSYAAARLLRDLYKIYGDWTLVIAAYNCGPERVNKAIHRAGGETDYWKIYNYLPRETRGYVPMFIATNYVMNYYCDHNICPMETTLPAKCDTVIVKKDVHFEQIATVLGIDLDQLKELNPQYRRNIINGNTKASAIRLPVSYIGTFIDNEDSIYNFNANQFIAKRNVVSIAKDSERGSSASRNTSVSRPSSHGQSKSAGKNGRGNTPARGSKKKPSVPTNVKVEKGQTLIEIAKKNNTTVEKLRKLNNIKGDNIRAGKSLKVK